MNKRSFTIDFNGETFSRLLSKTPRQAAQKAVLRMAKKYEEGTMPTGYKANDWNNFKLQETTRGSKKRTFQYRGIRKTLDKPIEAKIAGKVILCKYDTEVYSIKKYGPTATKSDQDKVNKKTSTKVVPQADTKVVAKVTKTSKRTSAKKPKESKVPKANVTKSTN